jgi:AcrR family transcriptional regulator
MARSYRSSVRDEAARTTRARILITARDLILGAGYPAFSVVALADAAGVSPQTIYNAVGGKAQVLKACYDVTLAGDDEPVAMSDRPAFRALAACETADAYAAAYAHWIRAIYEQVGALLGAVLGPGHRSDTGAAEFAVAVEQERRVGTTHAMTAFGKRFGLADGEALERTIDVVWTLNSPEVFDRLVHRCGWTLEAYESWLAQQLRAALLG